MDLEQDQDSLIKTSLYMHHVNERGNTTPICHAVIIPETPLLACPPYAGRIQVLTLLHNM